MKNEAVRIQPGCARFSTSTTNTYPIESFEFKQESDWSTGYARFCTSNEHTIRHQLVFGVQHRIRYLKSKPAV